MSRLYNLYLKLKKESSNTVYLFKSGIFYIALNDDAKLLSSKYNFKLTNLNSDVVKCGFPCSSFDKYYLLFNKDHISFRIIEDNTVFSSLDYIHNEKIKELISKIDVVSTDELSVAEAYRFIEDLKNIVRVLWI